MTDPISDMLTRIRNAQGAAKPEVLVPASKLKEHLAGILLQEGYLRSLDIQMQGTRRFLRLGLKYVDNRPAIRSIARVSKPGRRVYAAHTELPRVLSDLGVAILSTSNGLMTNKEARRRKLGGELICEVY